MLIFIMVFPILILKHYCNCLNSGYIIGGNKSNIVNFPYAAYLSAETKTAAYICGSSVINQQVLLTAAHCIANFIGKPWQVVVFAGGDDVRTATSVRRIYLVIIHEHYDDNQLTNDIALAKVTKPLTLGEFVKRTVISRIFPNNITVGIIAGWGIVDEETGKSGVKLIHLEQKIQSKAICYYLMGILNSKVFCAGSFESDDPRPSVGDSGSAFIVQGPLQIGLLSFRPHDIKAISVYTNLSVYYDWIKQNTLKLYCLKHQKQDE